MYKNVYLSYILFVLDNVSKVTPTKINSLFKMHFSNQIQIHSLGALDADTYLVP